MEKKDEKKVREKIKIGQIRLIQPRAIHARLVSTCYFFLSLFAHRQLKTGPTRKMWTHAAGAASGITTGATEEEEEEEEKEEEEEEVELTIL